MHHPIDICIFLAAPYGPSSPSRSRSRSRLAFADARHNNTRGVEGEAGLITQCWPFACSALCLSNTISFALCSLSRAQWLPQSQPLMDNRALRWTVSLRRDLLIEAWNSSAMHLRPNPVGRRAHLTLPAGRMPSRVLKNRPI
ncbi:hypothetical protein CC80DRAFT_17588 [Byssothecium circinans]|uniref:Uncharacterized protein n=1 Tax=Byssothecium circinans TaxID=147558 RepID=A0A6A5U188_9PLEO|nr:hypothetical protein CC80DRAFT_17588 [Byssothecium circinans]